MEWWFNPSEVWGVTLAASLALWMLALWMLAS